MPKPMMGIGTSAIIELSCHSLPEQCETVVALGGVGRARSSTRTSLVRAVQPVRRSAVAAASCAPLPIWFTFMEYLLSLRASVSRWAARARFVVRRARTASRRNTRNTPSLLGRTPRRRMVTARRSRARGRVQQYRCQRTRAVRRSPPEPARPRGGGRRATCVQASSPGRLSSGLRGSVVWRLTTPPRDFPLGALLMAVGRGRRRVRPGDGTAWDAARVGLAIAHPPVTPSDMLACNQPPPRIEAFAQPPPGGRYGLPITAQRYTSVVGVSVICWAFAAARIGYR